MAAASREARQCLRDGIRTGIELRDKWLPPLLENVTDKKLKALCRKAGVKYAASHPDKPPFASPTHWAPFIASGLAYPLDPS